MKKLVVLLSLLSFVVLGAYSSDKEEREELSVFELVETQYYKFIPTSITSQKGANRSLTSSYYLTVSGDSARAYLPYIGRAYGGAYGGDGAIEFDNLMDGYATELKVKKKEKNNQTYIEFEVISDKDTYSCSLFVGKGGSATLTVRSNNRQSVSFNGDVDVIDEE